MAKIPNALATFLLTTAPNIHSVELVGSWDNFRTPYKMQKDRKKGSGHWYGCHIFKDIICDGDPTDATPSRSGPLRQGGTYWYYYKLNQVTETHDGSRPSTTSCPLLPGQTVNVLEMPMEVEPDFIPTFDEIPLPEPWTLDPQERFQNPARKQSLRTAKIGAPRSLLVRGQRPKSAPFLPRSSENKETSLLEHQKSTRPQTEGSLQRIFSQQGNRLDRHALSRWTSSKAKNHINNLKRTVSVNTNASSRRPTKGHGFARPTAFANPFLEPPAEEAEFETETISDADKFHFTSHLERPWTSNSLSDDSPLLWPTTDDDYYYRPQSAPARLLSDPFAQFLIAVPENLPCPAPLQHAPDGGLIFETFEQAKQDEYETEATPSPASGDNSPSPASPHLAPDLEMSHRNSLSTVSSISSHDFGGDWGSSTQNTTNKGIGFFAVPHGHLGDFDFTSMETIRPLKTDGASKDEDVNVRIDQVGAGAGTLQDFDFLGAFIA